jgi:two-component system, NarL family, sensor histidine kinase UhpB
LCTSAFSLSAQRTLIDSLQRALPSHRNDTIGIRINILLSTEFSRIDINKSRECLYDGLAQIRRLKVKYGYSAIYSQFTSVFQNSGQLDSARKYLGLLKTFAEENPTRDNKANYHMTSGLFHKNRSEFDQALPHMVEALNYLDPEKNKVQVAGQMLNIGNIYQNLGSMEKALHYHLEALSLFIELKNQRGESFCLHGIGNDLLKLMRYDEALVYFDKSYKLKEQLKDARGMLSTITAMGSLYSAKNDYKTALKYYQQALTKARELKLQNDEASALYDVGLMHSKLQQNEAARQYLEESLPLARAKGDSLLAARVSAALSKLDTDKKQVDNLGDALQLRLERAEQSGDMVAVADAYHELAEHYAERGEPAKAYDLIRRSQALNDSLRGREVMLRFAELEQRYQNERHEKEIALLKKDQQLTQAVIARQRADQQIIVLALACVVITSVAGFHHFRSRSRAKRKAEIERVRNNIAQDLHDDIGSALSSIHIMSQLAMKDSANARPHLQRISDNASLMMDGMSDIVWSINPDNDSIERLVVKMKEFAQEILEPKGVAYRFDVSEKLSGLKLDVEKRKNLFLIFKESVNNAAKYSEGSEVTVRLYADGRKIHLSVKDNGKGFEHTTVRKGNGLTNMTARAKNMNGHLTHLAVPGQGTEVIAELPIT